MRIAKVNRQFTVSLRPEVFQRIRERSDEDNLSIAEVLRDVIDQGLRNWDKEEKDNGQ